MSNSLIKNFNNKKKPFIIAEISANHSGSLKNALKLIRKAHKAGASAVKIQTFSPDCMTLDHSSKDFFINDKKNLWNGSRLYDLYKRNQTNFNWHEKLFLEAKKNGILLFSSPFSEKGVEILEKLKCPIYKIASFELNHFPLLKKIAKTKKPIIMSTGMANLQEIKRSFQFLKKNGAKNISLLKCTSSYPAKHSEMNLETIKELKRIFKCRVGISDHSIGIGPSIASLYNGGSIIEKHFTLNKKNSPDGPFSLDENELNSLVFNCNAAFIAKGKIKFGPTKSEKRFIKRRRSIYVSSEIKKGEKFTAKNIKVVRPGHGMDPKNYYNILGKKASVYCKFGSPLKRSMISKQK